MKITTILFAVAATVLGGAAIAQEMGMQDKPGAPAMMAGMMERCKSMMAERQESMAAMQAMDDRLQEKVDAMKAARGEKKKLDAMEAVLTEMATQRHEMRDQMSAMMPRMMEHMREHMAMSMMQGMEGSGMCPMMKAMQASGTSTAQESATKPADAHAAHH